MNKEAHLDREAAKAAGADGEKHTRSELEKKYPVALAMFAVLAVLAWFTVGDGIVMMDGRPLMLLGWPVQLRLIPIAILALFAFRTYVAMQADRIRREKDSQ